MDRERPQHRRLIRILGGAVFAVFLLLALRYREIYNFVTTTPSAGAPPAASPLQAATAPPIPQRAAIAPRSNPGQSPAAGRAGADLVEICGHGRVELDVDDPQGYKYVGALSRPATARWLAALTASDDARARAAGLMLSPLVGIIDAPAIPDARNALARSALGSSDPAVYALALSFCRLGSPDLSNGPCVQLSPREWSELDPTNGVPWLLLAAAAHTAKDAVAEADAFRHVATAQQFETYTNSLLAFAQPSMPDDATPAEREYLAISTIGIEAAAMIPYPEVLRYCSKEALQNPRVRGQCEQVAETLVDKGTTILDLAEGKATGARLGWPEERLSRISQYIDALLQIEMSTSVPGAAMWNCENTTIANRFLNARSQLGERGAANEALLQSGRTPDELALQWRDYMNEMRSKAAAEAP